MNGHEKLNVHTVAQILLLLSSKGTSFSWDTVYFTAVRKIAFGNACSRQINIA